MTALYPTFHPILTVVIPAYRRVEALARTLDGLSAQCGVGTEEFEVFVVVDGGCVEVLGLLLGFDYTKYAKGTPSSNTLRRFTAIPEGGPAVSRNYGASLACGEILLFLDDDIIPGPRMVVEHLALHRSTSRAVGLGRIDLYNTGSLDCFEQYLYQFYNTHYAKIGNPSYTPTFWDALTGNLSVRASDFRAAGGFDETFSLKRHEDVELGYRLGCAGLSFHYLPDALGYHQYQKTFARGCREAYVNGISSVMMAARHPELHGSLIDARWAALPLAAKLAARPLLKLDHAKLSAWLERLQSLMGRLPGPARTLFYKTAYHLNFWQGVREEARRGTTSPKTGHVL